jgi:hypothetical protein
MLEFRLVEHFNRNYNTTGLSVGKSDFYCEFPVFTVAAGSTGIR